MNILKLPKRSIVVILVCGAGLLGIFLLTLYANYRTLEKLETKIAGLNDQIKGQELFAPVFQELFKKIQIKKIGGIQFPEPAKLLRDDSGKILSILQDIALANELKVEAMAPDVDSSIDGSKHLMINIVLLGEFFELRKFLLQLMSIPYLEHIEQIKIKTVEGAKEFRLRVWLAKE